MKQQTETPLYATVFYHIRKQLDLNWNEYIYLDMVYHLSKDGWCYKSLDNIADDLGMVKSGVQKMRNRLIEKGLLKKNIKGHVKTTVTYHSVLQSPKLGTTQETKRTTQYYAAVPLSTTKNNNKNNKEKKSDNFGDEKAQNPTAPGPGYASAMKKFEEIKRRSLSKMKPSYHA
jgi:predicted transcriptional regulator